MPVVGVPIIALNELLGREIPAEELFTHLERLGNDVDGIAKLQRFRCTRCSYIMELTESEEVPGKCGSCEHSYKDDEASRVEMTPLEVIRLELLPVRPDLFDVGGLARALKGYLEIETGPRSYEVTEGPFAVAVDSKLSEPTSLRPAIACAVVRNVTLDDEFVKTIMKMQENLHWALGRNRKHASIGVYDLDTVHPDFRYDSIGPEEIEFVPLNGMPGDGLVSVTPASVLAGHPKGKDFAHLLANSDRYPLLRDRDGQVLSMPPIINSHETKVTASSRNLFIDVTGFSRTLVGRCLNIVVTGIAEMDPGVSIESVEIQYPNETVRTPDMSVTDKKLDAAAAAKLIGLPLSTEEVAMALRRMRFDVSTGSGTELTVAIPPYRTDILHEVDLIEDVAMGHGFHKVVQEVCQTYTPGGELPLESACTLARRSMIGLGFLETLSLMLTSPESHYGRLLMEPSDQAVLTHNPASSDQSMLRTHLLEGILQSFSLSVGDSLPQRFFEIGDVVHLDSAGETGTRETRRLTAAVSGPKTGYAEVRSIVEALFREFDIPVDFEPGEHESMIPGRIARVCAVRDEERIPVGVIGEIRPGVLEKFSIVQPVALFELSIASAFEVSEAV